MRKDIAYYWAICLEFQQVKVEHQHLVDLLHMLPILEWKWETITLDFTIVLPRSKKKNDLIMVVVDKLSKFAHFIHVQSTYKTVQIADIFMKEINWLHGIPKVAIFDRDVNFTSAFWKDMFIESGTQVQFSTTYHLQTDRQIERVSQGLEDMLCNNQASGKIISTQWNFNIIIVIVPR